jgi:predicted Zn-ribbon and HTH transcriptional regulator
MKEWNSMSLSIIYGNLAKAAGKQQDAAAAARYGEHAQHFRREESSAGGPGGVGDLAGLLQRDLEESVPAAFEAAKQTGDRGALRALTWGEKVLKIQKSLLDRFVKQGEELLDGKELFVCQACGFIYLGVEAPGICPVCKAPASRFTRTA